MIKFLVTLVITAVLAGCSTHLALVALEQQADSQQEYINNYDYEMTQMEAEYYE